MVSAQNVEDLKQPLIQRHAGDNTARPASRGFYNSETTHKAPTLSAEETCPRWIIDLGSRLSPLLELMDSRIRSGRLMQMDETRVQVHKEPGREKHKTSYMWVARGGPPEKPLVRYMYYPNRSGAMLRSYIKDYRGYLQTDGYDGYTKIGEQDGIVHVGCMAHTPAAFYSLIESAKEADLEPYWYIRYLLAKLPEIEESAHRETLLPENVPVGMIYSHSL